ncbi:MAG: sugar ABC transporter ATP-binding protein [Anaerorhabdus sp.]
MLEMKNIYKSFGNNNVLNDINIHLDNGIILALLGENGAGKSTLMNILGGVLNANSGKILIDNELKNFSNPKESILEGIAFIHQELNLVNDLYVYENMFLGHEKLKNNVVLDVDYMVDETNKMFKKLNIDLDPKTLVEKLDPSYKQFVEIARALMMNAKYIIMDEPTTSLTNPEIKRVFELMRNLKKQGVGIIFISHKLEEIMKICDKYVVLRNGELVASGDTKDTTTHDLAKHMVGHEVRDEVLVTNNIIQDELFLNVENLSDLVHFNNITFNVRCGEILGVTGLLGDGRSELFLSIFGDNNFHIGKISVNGKTVKINSIEDALKLGIAYVPKNRKENAILKDLSILDNGTVVSLKEFSKKLGIIDLGKQRKAFKKIKDTLNIKMDKENDLITSLSGGNQQKVVLSKWLLNNPKLLILDNPTQGVDVGSKEEIYDIISNLAKNGVAVVLLSNEADEIIRNCNRALVMYHGAIQGELTREQMSEHKIMTLATGGKIDENSKEVRR